MPLKIFKRSDIWHYRGTVAGRRLRGSTATKDKAIAARLAAEIEARQWKGHLDGPASVLTFAQAAILYRRAAKSGRFLDAVEDYWRDTPIKEITASAIKDSCRKLYPQTGPASWNRQVITPTQAIINHASEMELCPPIRVKRFKVVAKVKEPASWTWVTAFASKAPLRLGALAYCMFLTGARVSECLSLVWTDISLSSRTVRIRMGKSGGDERVANLPPELVVALANLEGREGRVFGFNTYPNVLRQWKNVCRRAGIKMLTPHCMRHGFATEMLRKGFDVKTVARAGGWKDSTTVLRTYAHAITDLRITDALTFDTPEAQSHTPVKKRIGAANA